MPIMLPRHFLRFLIPRLQCPFFHPAGARRLFWLFPRLLLPPPSAAPGRGDAADDRALEWSFAPSPLFVASFLSCECSQPSSQPLSGPSASLRRRTFLPDRTATPLTVSKHGALSIPRSLPPRSHGFSVGPPGATSRLLLPLQLYHVCLPPVAMAHGRRISDVPPRLSVY